MATRKCRNIYFPTYFMAVRKFTSIHVPKYFVLRLILMASSRIHYSSFASYIMCHYYIKKGASPKRGKPPYFCAKKGHT